MTQSKETCEQVMADARIETSLCKREQDCKSKALLMVQAMRFKVDTGWIPGQFLRPFLTNQLVQEV